jgi:hypothetical protein
MHRRSILLVLAGSLLLGCKSLNEAGVMPARNIDDRLAHYIDDFVADAGSYGRVVAEDRLGELRVFTFVDNIGAQKQHYGQAVSTADSDLVGSCATLRQQDDVGLGHAEYAVKTYDWREIWLDRSYEDQVENGTMALKELVYHELGHCLLDLIHAPSTPHEIMSPAISGNSAWLTSNWSSLAETLFTTGPH